MGDPPQDRRGGPVAPDELSPFCGVSIGFEDGTADDARVGRAPLGEMVAFMDGLYTFVSQPITAPFLAAPTAWLIWHISYVISTKGVS